MNRIFPLQDREAEFESSKRRSAAGRVATFDRAVDEDYRDERDELSASRGASKRTWVVIREEVEVAVSRLASSHRNPCYRIRICYCEQAVVKEVAALHGDEALAGKASYRPSTLRVSVPRPRAPKPCKPACRSLCRSLACRIYAVAPDC